MPRVSEYTSYFSISIHFSSGSEAYLKADACATPEPQKCLQRHYQDVSKSKIIFHVTWPGKLLKNHRNSCNEQLKIISKFSLQQNHLAIHLNLITSHASMYLEGEH